MKVDNVKISQKAPIICTFEVTFIKLGVTLRELRLMDTNGKKWVAMPSRSYEDQGKKKYFSYIGMEKDRKEAFDAKCIELLEPFLKPAQANNPYEEIPF